jgi:hypothetical protein
MNAMGCCAEHRRGSCLASGSGRRTKTTAEWATPALILLLLPKCPMCVAAYVVLFTGIGLSLQAASLLRGAVISLCIAAMTLPALRLLHRKIAIR